MGAFDYLRVPILDQYVDIRTNRVFDFVDNGDLAEAAHPLLGHCAQ